MALEVASFIGQLDKTWPVTGDQIAQGDDQIRLLKATLQKTFPGMMGEVLRVVGKASGFTPSVDESTVIYNCTAAITVTLPALGGVVAGTYWFVNAGNGAVTLAPSSAETVNGAATVTVASGTWALITKASSTNWVTLGIPAMTAAAIVAALGTTAVTNATNAVNATTAANGGVTSVNGQTGAVTVPSGVTSVNGNSGAVTAAQIAAAAVAGLGYTPYGDNIVPVSSPSTIIHGAATNSVTGYTSTKACELVVLCTGTVRVYMTITPPLGGSGTGYGRLYKNGVAYAAEVSRENSSGPITVSYDVPVERGDLIQLYLRSAASGDTTRGKLAIASSVNMIIVGTTS